MALDVQKGALSGAQEPRVQHVRAVFPEVQGSQYQCCCDHFPSAQRQHGREEDTLQGHEFYFPSPSSNISSSPIHHSDSSLSYKQMTKDFKAQCVTGGTSGCVSLARALWFRAPESGTRAGASLGVLVATFQVTSLTLSIPEQPDPSEEHFPEDIFPGWFDLNLLSSLPPPIPSQSRLPYQEIGSCGRTCWEGREV